MTSNRYFWSFLLSLYIWLNGSAWSLGSSESDGFNCGLRNDLFNTQQRFLSSLRQLQQTDGTHYRERARFLYELGKVEIKKGDLDSAEWLLLEAAALQTRLPVGDPDRIRTATALVQNAIAQRKSSMLRQYACMELSNRIAASGKGEEGQRAYLKVRLETQRLFSDSYKDLLFRRKPRVRAEMEIDQVRGVQLNLLDEMYPPGEDVSQAVELLNKLTKDPAESPEMRLQALITLSVLYERKGYSVKSLEAARQAERMARAHFSGTILCSETEGRLLRLLERAWSNEELLQVALTSFQENRLDAESPAYENELRLDVIFKIGEAAQRLKQYDRAEKFFRMIPILYEQLHRRPDWRTDWASEFTVWNKMRHPETVTKQDRQELSVMLQKAMSHRQQSMAESVNSSSDRKIQNDLLQHDALMLRQLEQLH